MSSPLLVRVLRLLCEEYGGAEVRAAVDEVTTIEVRQRRRRSVPVSTMAKQAAVGVPVSEIDAARARRARREG